MFQALESLTQRYFLSQLKPKANLNRTSLLAFSCTWCGHAWICFGSWFVRNRSYRLKTALNLNLPITRHKSETFSQVSSLLRKRETAKQSDRSTYTCSCFSQSLWCLTAWQCFDIFCTFLAQCSIFPSAFVTAIFPAESMLRFRVVALSSFQSSFPPFAVGAFSRERHDGRIVLHIFHDLLTYNNRSHLTLNRPYFSCQWNIATSRWGIWIYVFS